MDKHELSKIPSHFSCTYDRSGYVGVLTFAGELTPDCSQILNKRLVDSMIDADFVVVNLEQVSCIDDDCMSLFCMAARTAYRLNKRLHLGRAKQEQQLAASHMCSSNYSRNACHDCATHCFWLDQVSEDDANPMMNRRGN